jgi:hypothetical protein
MLHLRVDRGQTQAFTEFMRIVVITCALLTVLGSGCIHKKPNVPGKYAALPGLPADTAVSSQTSAPQNQTQTVQSGQKATVTPENALVGKVKRVNPAARFVVLSFPIGQLPAPDQQFGVYRRGLKVGEIKITNQQLNEYIVADIVDGDVEEGDEVRNK